MPLNVAAQLENNFTRGLITEATGLNFPENACTETYNCVFHENARVERRLGFDYEDGFEFCVSHSSLVTPERRKDTGSPGKC